MNKRHMFIVSLVAFFIFLFVVKPDASNIQTTPLQSKERVLAFGDSLTYGSGAHSQSYPIQLQNIIQKEVINAGIPGETSSQGLERFPALLQEQHPALVILCHGGNDIIRQQSKITLKENLVKMIQMSKKIGAQVLLVGVPDFHMFGFTTDTLYEDIAEQENILYEGEILSKIENDPAFKSDRIHPNAKGYGLMAKAFAEILREYQIVE